MGTYWGTFIVGFHVILEVFHIWHWQVGLILLKCLSPLLSCKTILKWKMPIKIRMGKAHSSFCMHKCPCRHGCMHVYMQLCMFAFVCIHVYACDMCAIWNQRYWKVTTTGQQRPKIHTVSHGSCSLASACYKELQSSLTATARTYQIWWTITFLLRERHMGSIGRFAETDHCH